MANMELITSVTVGSGGAASVTIPATGTIPQTYTDLMLVMSARTNRANIADGYLIKPNNTTPTIRYLTGDGTTAYSGTNYSGIFPGANATASTFGNSVAYFPNYANTSYNKSFSVDDVSENNATGAYATVSANLYSSTSAITTIVIESINSTNIVEGSTFYLYGISNVTSGTKATGGVVSSDGTYYYHMFPFSGTFTPTTNLTADYLVVAGGGAGGGDYYAGGGGAGGIVYGTGKTLTTTNYTVVIGSGGAGTSSVQAGSNGVDSSFNSVTAIGGGGGKDSNSGSGSNGGCGGGGGANRGSTNYGSSTQTSPAGHTGYGNRGGGSGSFPPQYNAGGGGGAGAVGDTGGTTTSARGSGGAGLDTWSSWATATGTGVNGYYAGGGGGALNANVGYGAPTTGGAGGGGQAAQYETNNAGSGVTNTGSGGGGANGIYTSGSGGSGLVIIRYAI